jgi:hypothetical protein
MSLLYGTYMLTSAATNAVVASRGTHGYGLSIDDVETALNDKPHPRQ